MALRKNALAAPTSRLPLRRTSTVLPSPSTARYTIYRLAADLHVGLVDAPRWAGRPGEPVPAGVLTPVRNRACTPAHDGGVSQRKAALRDHLHQIAVAEFEPRYHCTHRTMTSGRSGGPRTTHPVPGTWPSYCLQPIGGPEYGGAQTVCTRARFSVSYIRGVHLTGVRDLPPRAARRRSRQAGRMSALSRRLGRNSLWALAHNKILVTNRSMCDSKLQDPVEQHPSAT